jgi:hypothetical protein
MGVTVTGLKEVVVEDVEKVKVLMSKGSSRRQVGATKLNEQSSRSHAIFRVVIEARDRRGHGEEGAAR